MYSEWRIYFKDTDSFHAISFETRDEARRVLKDLKCESADWFYSQEDIDNFRSGIVVKVELKVIGGNSGPK